MMTRSCVVTDISEVQGLPTINQKHSTDILTGYSFKSEEQRKQHETITNCVNIHL
uniref:Uncharacterized protein n=1 Tax=Arion vulgaris TaxID=1028688 RepID=A0A0B6XZW6_9EUPU